ncbi:PadR family transcriptional regulator [Actinoplanes sp. NPDC049681]|uniref:PadR family transcriptional regulator n=1 Tax=Actinoplanes sp. NPDC049681 TaxID=3363905 RepID=UPI0037994AB3
MAIKALNEQSFFILTSLVETPRHGYGIMGDVEELSEGRVVLKVGTLYGMLDRLVSDGLVELDREEPHNGRLRRYFRLTDDGLAALMGEVDRQRANATAASVRLRAIRPAARPAAEGL